MSASEMNMGGAAEDIRVAAGVDKSMSTAGLQGSLDRLAPERIRAAFSTFLTTITGMQHSVSQAERYVGVARPGAEDGYVALFSALMGMETKDATEAVMNGADRVAAAGRQAEGVGYLGDKLKEIAEAVGGVVLPLIEQYEILHGQVHVDGSDMAAKQVAAVAAANKCADAIQP